MGSLPTYVTLSYAVGLAGAPLILLVPPPLRVARHSTVLCVLLLRVAAVCAVLAAVFAALDAWWPALTLGGVLLSVLMTMFWTASEPRRRRTRPERDDDSSDGGGGDPRRPRAPQPPGGPGGHDLDWDAFDRHRADWQRERPLVPTG